MKDERIRRVIDRLIRLYVENPGRWSNEREIHYEFFGLLFDEFEPEEIRENFRWEYPVIFTRSGGKRDNANIDLICKSGDEKWVAIEIEFVSPGVELKKELRNCISKLRDTDECRVSMERGYIIPFLKREADKTARGYDTSYEELCGKIVEDAESTIGDSPIEIVTDGILLT